MIWYVASHCSPKRAGLSDLAATTLSFRTSRLCIMACGQRPIGTSCSRRDGGYDSILGPRVERDVPTSIQYQVTHSWLRIAGGAPAGEDGERQAGSKANPGCGPKIPVADRNIQICK